MEGIMKKISILLVALMAGIMVSAQTQKERISSLESELSRVWGYVQKIDQRVDTLWEDASTLYANSHDLDQRTQALEKRTQVLEDGFTKTVVDIKDIKGQLKEYKDLKAYVDEKLSWLQNTAKQGKAKDLCFGSGADNYDVFFIGPFAVNSASLSVGMKTSLQKVVAIMKDTVEKKEIIEIDGFASIDGSPQLNDSLSLQRATAVATFLEKKEVAIPKNGIAYFGGTIRYGTPIDNRCVVIFAAAAKK